MVLSMGLSMGGGNLGLHTNRGGSSFGSNVEKPTSWDRRGESRKLESVPPGSAKV